MKKCILHLMGMDVSKYGSFEKFNVELSRQLSALGYQSVFVYEKWPVAQQYVDDLIKTGAEIRILCSKHPLRFCSGLLSLLREFDFSVLHAHFTKARFFAIPVAFFCGLKNILYTFHSKIPNLRKIKPHTRLWYHWANKHCRIVAVSKQIKEQACINWPGAEIRNLYLGISPIVYNRYDARSAFNIPSEKLMVMCTANFNHIKGLDVLVNAASMLRQRGLLSDVLFYVVGQPDKDKKELMQQVSSLQLEDYFHLEGITNRIYEYLAAADIYVQPSRSEGLPLSLMEASSLGLPIVASRVGGIPEVAHEDVNAFLFDSENEEQLANALERFIVSPNLRQEMGERGYRIFEEFFSSSKNVSELIEYYRL